VNAETFRRFCDQIAWSQHGGSGFSFTRADMLAMSAADLVHHSNVANEKRAKEADAMRKAAQSQTGTQTRTIGPPG
jgi:hypothetical protein